ncbi:hypothetical protein C2845_PM07G32780 [Panicum miliaceum]|uniref:Uncharacterized protein n=1 Tax=Panicum miliaceum TaxID=4540 RepID=A0A3L6SJC2_PANMI|nr:hypothetical protein C2845_PM07G32780 [Panicum miliaceum]
MQALSQQIPRVRLLLDMRRPPAEGERRAETKPTQHNRADARPHAAKTPHASSPSSRRRREALQRRRQQPSSQPPPTKQAHTQQVEGTPADGSST